MVIYHLDCSKSAVSNYLQKNYEIYNIYNDINRIYNYPAHLSTVKIHEVYIITDNK